MLKTAGYSRCPEEVLQWQGRRLEVMYPVVYCDTLRVKIREDAMVSNKAAFLALGIAADDSRIAIQSSNRSA